MPRADKWQLVALVVMIFGLALVVLGTVMTDEGGASVWWLLLMLFNVGVQCWDLYSKRRKRRAEHRALLTHLDRPMRRKTRRRRCRRAGSGCGGLRDSRSRRRSSPSGRS
ncbi:hypothetical protein ACIRL3_25995 [Streptomyces sp. NPDC102384]|uniref:hypothetical protein n=1 Tax=Streptomyces sp. NPDC102384 TaxID=3366166 RepID=UPI0037F6A14F